MTANHPSSFARTTPNWRRLLRWAAGLWVVWMLCVSSSYAQSCTNTVITRTKVTRSTIPFNTGSVNGETILDSGSVTANYTGCSLFNNTNTNWSINHGTLFPFTSSSTISVNSPNVDLRIFAKCQGTFEAISNNCFDSGGKNVRSDIIPTSGISLNVRYTITGLNSSNTNCITITSYTAGGSPTVFQASRLTTNATGCVSITAKIDVEIRQNALFTPSNAVRMIANASSVNFLTLSPDLSIGQTLVFNGTSQVNFIPLSSTCALSLSNSFIDIGNLSLTTVSSAAAGATVVSRPLTVTINNCPAGFATGKNKILQWVFSKPNTDRTRLENEMLLTGAAGLSAQIIADQRFDVFTPTTVLSNIVTSGQSYITSGTTSDNQTLNYQVNLIRNSDAVKEGGFRSTATVTLSYK